MNWPSLIKGAVIWAIAYAIVGGLAMALFLAEEFVRELERLGRPLDLSSGSVAFLGAFGLVFSIGMGLISIWLYAAIRPRYGPGPKTAVTAAFIVWLLALVAPVGHLAAFGVVSVRFAAVDLPTELVAVVVATLAGAWAYRE